ncbi:MAG: HAD family hydrolase [candidate division KSB1 bacterium]|nr:HAD family hydrolase [candidate division KSB1 bacterium]MDZ7303903.1 HAD family hydrolase [candidate division KSB1 bacterium]MDZ7313064.1 HAD family hydrolase [candidate division KSB1 bacterium]
MNYFSQIEAILFDVGQTFVFPDFPFLIKLLAEYGVTTDILLLKKGAAIAREKIFRHRDEERWKEYFTCWMQSVGAPEHAIPEILARIYERHKREHLWNWVDPAAPETFARLKSMGYRLGVISNADGTVPDALSKFGVARFFDCIIDSGLVGVEKPDPRIFEMALQQLGLPAERCIYVGDNYDRDVIGARQAGLIPILIDPFELVEEKDVVRIRELGELVRILKNERESG